MTFEKLRGKLILSLLLGVVVFVGISAYADFNDVIDGLGNFNWWYLPAILGLTFINYILRFFKWQYYLRTIGVAGFSTRDSFLTYFAGLGMTVTPAKAGEWVKCYLLRAIHGTPFSRSAPIVMVERLTDCLALVLLGLCGLIVFGDAWPAFVVVVAGGALLVLVARYRPLAYWLLGRLQGLPLLTKVAQHAEAFYESCYALVGPIPLVSMVLLSVISWGFEILAFYLVLLGLGLDGSWDLLLKASFIMPAATLAGALLLTPGGLGVAEGGITGLSQVLIDLPKGQAVVATLIIRLGTLWFGVFVGLIALALVSRRLSRGLEPVVAPPGLPAEESI